MEHESGGIMVSASGFGSFRIRHLVLDFNGTIADRGRIMDAVRSRLVRLAEQLDVHVLTADTFGTVRAEVERVFPEQAASGRITTDILPPPEQRRGRTETELKLCFVQGLGQESCCAVGNGRNDAAMLGAAALGICVMGREGCSPASLQAADIVAASIADALDLLLEPRCCTATLRQ